MFVNALEAGARLILQPLDKQLRGLMQPNERVLDEGPCGAGKAYVAVGVDGTVYPCHRFLSANSFRGAFPIGSIYDGFDEGQRLPFLRMKRKFTLGCDTQCDDCDLLGRCSGGCMAANYAANGHLLLRPPHARFHELIWCNVAQAVADYFNETPCREFEERYRPSSEAT